MFFSELSTTLSDRLHTRQSDSIHMDSHPHILHIHCIIFIALDTLIIHLTPAILKLWQSIITIHTTFIVTGCCTSCWLLSCMTLTVYCLYSLSVYCPSCQFIVCITLSYCCVHSVSKCWCLQQGFVETSFSVLQRKLTVTFDLFLTNTECSQNVLARFSQRYECSIKGLWTLKGSLILIWLF